MTYHARFSCRPCSTSWGCKVEAAAIDRDAIADNLARALLPHQKCRQCKRPGKLVKLAEHREGFK